MPLRGHTAYASADRPRVEIVDHQQPEPNMAVLISWGEKKPDERLVELMIRKAKAFHVVCEPVFGYGYRWAKEGERPADYDRECWRIRDDLCMAGPSSHGLEGCQGLLEGLQEGWDLAMSTMPAKKVKVKKV